MTQVFLSTLKEKGRTSLSIQVNVFDETDIHALSASVEWFVTKA